jgi:threonine dehydrogenase-like Zn-dependent dehydrogenase
VCASSVTVIGDGAVGLSAVLAARRLRAEQTVLMGSHKVRTDLGREFGATEVVSERGAGAAERVRELTGGNGTGTVLDCVGITAPAGRSYGGGPGPLRKESRRVGADPPDLPWTRRQPAKVRSVPCGPPASVMWRPPGTWMKAVTWAGTATVSKNRCPSLVHRTKIRP